MNPATPSKEWPGYNKLKYLFVFGDSYSSIGHVRNLQPTEEQPLGMEFPGGQDVWAEDVGKANWVGHLINTYYSDEKSLLVYDYAVGGATIDGVGGQVKIYRQRGGPGHPDSEECWQGNNSLFVTWIGFNDLAYGANISASMDHLFEIQEELYGTGARNFLFMTTAPLPNPGPNSATGLDSLYARREARCKEWNDALTSRAQNEFAQAHPDASIFVFDSNDVFKKMLANPTEYGFSKKAGRGSDQEMYWDPIHPTSAVHKIVAKAFAEFLLGKSVEEKAERFSVAK